MNIKENKLVRYFAWLLIVGIPWALGYAIFLLAPEEFKINWKIFPLVWTAIVIFITALHIFSETYPDEETEKGDN